MTTSLLDVNVLLALMDGAHVDHERAHAWASESLDEGWATCALTQNGFVRIISQPRYPNQIPTVQAVELLRQAVAHPRHEFWPCDLALTDHALHVDRLLGPHRLTDVYLLALAVRRDAVFVTFDRHIDVSAVAGATSRHLALL